MDSHASQTSSDDPRVVGFAWKPTGDALGFLTHAGCLHIEEGGAQKQQVSLQWPAGSLSWSPQGDRIACAPRVDTSKVSVVDLSRGREVRVVRDDAAHSRRVAWSPDGELLASGNTTGQVNLWNTSSWQQIGLIDIGIAPVTALSWSPSGHLLLIALRDGALIAWSPAHDRAQYVARPFTGERVTYVAWSPTNDYLATAGPDPTVTIWDARSWTPFVVIEGHTAPLLGTTYAFNGETLATMALDGMIRFYRTADWSLRDVWTDIKVPEVAGEGSAIAFSPHSSDLAFIDDGGSAVAHRAVAEDRPTQRRKHRPMRHYANAKVVLVGDSGVGKSGLGFVLADAGYRATDSTHGRQVWSLGTGDAVSTVDCDREVYLWDLAGQPGYRLTHQLHLGEVALALVVFDSRSEIDPLAGVRHWVRALKQAERLTGSGVTVPRLLVAARTDRGLVGMGRERIRQTVESLEFIDYVPTSAKEGWGVDELRSRILAEINWATLPRVSSTDLFAAIREFLMNTRSTGDVLVTEEHLYRAFLTQHPDLGKGPDFQREFRTCIGRADARGLVRRLSFGGLVLLKPELVDSYAAALVNAAKAEPDGMGTVSEEAAYDARLTLPASERLADGETERLLLIATVEDLLRHEIALREQSEEGPLLVFPSEFTREVASRPLPQEKLTHLHFEGPVQHVYATLVVRLARGSFLRPVEMWRNGATFDAVDGRCAVTCEEVADGEGVVTLYVASKVGEVTRTQVEAYVETHLRRRGLPESVRTVRIRYCPGCRWEIDPNLVAKIVEHERDVFVCPACSSTLSVQDRTPGARERARPKTAAEHHLADRRAEIEAAETSVRGKAETGEFDVFLAHNSADKEFVRAVAAKLREHAINPWLDEEQVPPGRWFQEVIEQAIPRVKSAAIVCGKKGLGRWQALELRGFVSRCVDEGIPIIPVLAPGVGDLPGNLIFLRQLNWVRFRNSANDAQALNRLIWGITGSRADLLER
jgi:WD40 repeat protein